MKKLLGVDSRPTRPWWALAGRGETQRGPITGAVGAAARRSDDGDAPGIVEELQRSRWPHATVTRWAHGGCGRMRRQTSSTMPIASPSSAFLACARKTHARDPSGLHHGLLGLIVALGIVVGGCGAAEEPAPEPEPEPVPLDRSVLADPTRPEDELAQDEGRKAIDVYELFGVQPGQTVADVYCDSGYNTHLLSRLVGDAGKVYSVFEFYGDPELFDGQLYRVDSVTARIEEAGLRNVELAMHLSDVPADSVDVAVAIRNYHDVEWLFPNIKRADQVAEFLRMVKPGGIVGIVDVATPSPGWDEAAHRLNKQVVIDDFTAGGFELVEESDMLANPEDDHSQPGFPTRYLSDRYVLKFRKPGN